MIIPFLVMASCWKEYLYGKIIMTTHPMSDAGYFTTPDQPAAVEFITDFTSAVSVIRILLNDNPNLTHVYLSWHVIEKIRDTSPTDQIRPSPYIFAANTDCWNILGVRLYTRPN